MAVNGRGDIIEEGMKVYWRGWGREKWERGKVDRIEMHDGEDWAYFKAGYKTIRGYAMREFRRRVVNLYPAD